jgi:predicted NAD/FAD-binding protein
MKTAVIGSGISGLAAALRLSASRPVTLYEAQPRLGGHAHSVDISLEGITAAVDTGFLVYNERTYPQLIALFAELDVPTAPSDMSFSVSVGPHDFEWCGTSLATLFAQPGNALRPGFWRMLVDILRFNRQATRLALQADAGLDAATLAMPLGDFLARHGYSRSFRDGYLLPMAAAIWSCPMSTMAGFPVGSFARFFHNHGLLSLTDRPQWHTVRGGSREYVRRIAAQLDDVRLGTPVLAVRRLGAQGAAGVAISTASGTEAFDQVVLACHSDQAMALLADLDPQERDILQAIPYQPNQAWLHTDAALMPRRRSAWAAWNYLSDGNPQAPKVSVTYWLNRLQPLPFRQPVLLSLNPLQAPADERVIARFDYEHPIFDQAAVAAQRRLRNIQGRRNTWFAGAWTAYGFHEDGLRSGLAVADDIVRLGSRARAAA